MIAENVALAAVETNEGFKLALKRALKELGLTVVEFSKQADIPQSTIYKIISEGRDPNLKTVRQIVSALRKIEMGGEENRSFVAVIASRPYLNEIVNRKTQFKGEDVLIREYPANNFEEAIIASIHAEKDGAKALVCAPIVSPTIEKILTIPIITIMPKDGFMEAVEIAARKISG